MYKRSAVAKRILSPSVPRPNACPASRAKARQACPAARTEGGLPFVFVRCIVLPPAAHLERCSYKAPRRAARPRHPRQPPQVRRPRNRRPIAPGPVARSGLRTDLRKRSTRGRDAGAPQSIQGRRRYVAQHARLGQRIPGRTLRARASRQKPVNAAAAPLQTLVYGANRDRTGDLLLAKQALSQLSYGPKSLQYTPS